MLKVKRLLTSSVISWCQLFLCNKEMSKIQEIMKITENSWYSQIKSSYLMNNLKNFNLKLFHAKFHPLFRRCIFGKTTGPQEESNWPTFWKCLVPIPNALEKCSPKTKLCNSKTILKRYTLDCSCKCLCTFLHSYTW